MFRGSQSQFFCSAQVTHLAERKKKIYTIKRPTLFLWGLADPYFNQDTLTGIGDLVPDLELVTYPQGTHWLHHEAEDLNLRIDTFIRKLQ